jgi:predicted nucleic acid-binding protein
MLIFQPYTVVLDADILFRYKLSNFLLRLSNVEVENRRLFFPRGSEAIHAEWICNRLQEFTSTKEKSLLARKNAINLAFEKDNYLVKNNLDYSNDECAIQVNDKDRHVIATARHCNAQFVLTLDTKLITESRDFSHLLIVKSPDVWLMEDVLCLPDSGELFIERAFVDTFKSYKDPPLSQRELLQKLMADLPESMGWLYSRLPLAQLV